MSPRSTMLTGISGSKHSRSTSMTSSGLSVESGATWVVTCSMLMESPGVPVKSMISWGVLQRQACGLPGARAAAERDDVLDAQRDGHLGRDGRALADRAHEDRPVPELLGRRVGQDRAQDDVARAGQVPALPLPVLAHVHHLIAVVH